LYQHAQSPQAKTWSRCKSMANFIRTVFGWGAIGFSVVIPIAATVTMLVIETMRWALTDTSISAATANFHHAVTSFLTVAATTLVPSLIIGCCFVGIGSGLYYLSAVMQAQAEQSPARIQPPADVPDTVLVHGRSPQYATARKEAHYEHSRNAECRSH